jgi:rSAM/selenodomain-associated transferase 2
MPISIIIPVLNEEVAIERLLQQLQSDRLKGHEVIVVDGGSNDKTVKKSKPLADHVISFTAGRAVQMNKGASLATHDTLWFLHADTLLPDNATDYIEQALNKNAWGRFDIKLSGSHISFRMIEKMINIRSRFSSIATGDQGIFVRRQLFDLVRGYADLPLMEDVNLSKRLKQISKPVCLKNPLITSSRRWEEKGILSTIFLMWRLRFLYWIGVNATILARQYR